MFSLLDIRHVHVSKPRKAWKQELEKQELEKQEALEGGSRHGAAPAEELAIFGLVEARREASASLAGFDRLSAGERLAAAGLVSTGRSRPSGQESLADASPFDLLGHLGLLG